MTTRQQVMDVAREPIGTKWVHQGRLIHHGLDCVGVLLYTARRLRMPISFAGVAEYETPPYQAQAKWDEFVAYFEKVLTPIHPSQAKPGDALCFRQFQYPCHCGILTEKDGELWFVHSYRPVGRVVEERYSDRWRNLTRAAFLFPGVE